jgi:putative endonuclease
MASHNELGKEGEQLALGYLREKGFSILHCNWRFSHFEIDIIALKNDRLHFIEVKSRKYSPVAFPEESVTKKKFRFIKTAAEEFLIRHPHYRHVQFDVLSITLYGEKEPEFFLIEDVFFN